MTAEKKEYTKLPGSGTSSEGMASTRYYLWLGADHLLSVIREGYYEQYKRFYFKDIQAIILRKTLTGRIVNYVLGAFLLVFLALLTAGITNNWDEIGIWMLAWMAGFFLIFLLLNWFKGPTCQCFLRTAVQVDRLYSLNRLPVAMRTIRLIAATVEATQGKLSQEEAIAVENTSRATQPSTLQPSQPVPAAKLTIRHDGGLVHIFLFSLLLLVLINSVSRFFLKDGLLSGEIGFILYTLIITLALISLIKQGNTNLTRGIKIITWCTLFYIVIGGIMMTAFLITNAVLSPTPVGNPFSLPPPNESILAWIMCVYSAVCSGVLGLLGLFLVYDFRRKSRIPPPLAVPPSLSTPPPEEQAGLNDSNQQDRNIP